MQKVKKDAPLAQLPDTEGVGIRGAKEGSALQAPEGEDIDGGDVDEVIKLDEGEAITCIYKGYKETKGAKPGETNRLHKLVMADGVSRGVWGTIQLNSMLDRCVSGDALWIAYLGKEDLPGGQKTMHNWRVVRTAKAGAKKVPF